MANEQNLIPNSQRSPSELREQCRKGGIRSGEVRREKKLWKEEIVKRLNAKDWEEIMDTLINNAKKNGGKDFEILRDTMGQHPKDGSELNDSMNEINKNISNIAELLNNPKPNRREIDG